MTADYSLMFKNWHPVTSAPIDGSMFMGRQTGTNKAFAVSLDGETSTFYRVNGDQVDICQWISFAEYAQIQHCVWRTK